MGLADPRTGQRPYAVVADRDHSLDIMFVRYNTAHPGARADVFPYLQTARQSLMFAFKSMQSRVTAEDLAARGWPGGYWVPDAVDYYRFALSRPEFNGVLCSPGSPEEVNEIVRALEKPPLSEEEQQYMMWISRATGRHFR